MAFIRENLLIDRHKSWVKVLLALHLLLISFELIASLGELLVPYELIYTVGATSLKLFQKYRVILKDKELRVVPLEHLTAKESDLLLS